MEAVLSRYIWKHTKAQQLYVLVVVLVSMVPYYLSFDLPKQIISGPIQGKGFPNPDSTVRMFGFSVGSFEVFGGFDFNRFQALVALCLVFLLLVVVNGGFKYYINTYKGRLGERMLRRIRFELIDRVLRYSPSYFKRVKSSEVATMIKDEVEPLGGFIGDAFVAPLLLGGQALTALAFIVLQNFWLGMIALAIVGVQLLIIPQMRKRLLRLGRERQLTARELSGRVGEIVDGIAAVHTHDTSNYERAEIAARLGRIFKIRYDLYQWKFLVKFLNNFLAQVTPFLFYLLGGYFVLAGKLDVGQLVAVIAAYKDLPGPLKELIDWDQTRQDVQVKYAQVVEQFDVRDIMAPETQPVTTDPGHLGQPLSAQHLSLVDDTGAKLLESTSLTVHPGETVAIVGTPGGGAEAIADAFARLIWPTSGRVLAGREDLAQMPESVTGRRMTYAGSDANLFQGTILDNILYGLKHAPMSEPTYDGKEALWRKWEVAEARKAGNPAFDMRGEWVDYRRAGVDGPGDLFEALLPVLDTVMLANDVFEIGLRTAISPERHPDIPPRIVEARSVLRRRMADQDMAGLVIPFLDGVYNPEATVAENLLFGTATGPAFADQSLARNPYVRRILAETGLDQRLYEMGYDIAENIVELFRDMTPDPSLMQQVSITSEDELQQLKVIAQRRDGRDFASADEDDKERLTKLAFVYVEARTRFGVLDDALMPKIVEAREIFHKELPPELAGGIERYDPAKFNRAATLLDNALFGRLGHRFPDAAGRIHGLIRKTFEELDVYVPVIGIGLEFNVGSAGRRLTSGQRQKVNLARAILKRSEVLLLNRPLSTIDSRVQENILKNVLDYKASVEPKASVLWVLSSAELAKHFDRVVVFDRGAPVEDGSFAALVEREGVFKRMLT
jgi:putative ABC transport system ATP-binding protein